MAGRSLNPGEKGPQELIDQRNVLNRTIRAQVVDVNKDDGFLILNYESLPSGGKYATVNPLWASFPEVGGASWGRYMPQRSDIVKISFDYDDKPHIIGYDVIAGKEGVGDGRAGWPGVSSLHKSAKQDPNAKITVEKNGRQKQVSIAKYAQFAPLNPGEYDFMSSGGSYIYGNNVGRLYLAGGSVSISLIKNDLRIDNRAQVVYTKADDSELRFGQVRRPGADTLDKVVATDPTGKLKEFTVNIRETQTPGVFTSVADMSVGHVINSAGAPELLNGNELRLFYAAYNTNVPTLHLRVDKLGNMDINAPASTFSTTTTNLSHTVSTKTYIACPDINLGSQNATDYIVLGTTYRSNETIFHNSLITDLTSLAAQLTTLAGTLSAAGGALTGAATSLGTVAGGINAAAIAYKVPAPPALPVGSVGLQAAGVAGVAAAGTVGTAGASLTTAGTANLSAIIATVNLISSRITTFEAQAQTYLSKTTKAI